MATPFIDSLPAEQLALVRKRARGSKRPKYYDAVAGQAQLDAERAHTELPQDFVVEVQISEDLEAALILLPTQTKQKLIGFINELILEVGNTGHPEELELMAEVVSLRGTNYARVNVDLAEPLLRFDEAREDIFNFLNRRTAQKGKKPAQATEALLPDLSAFLSVFAEDYQLIATVDVLAMHDKVTDALTLGAYTDLGVTKRRQLTSWVTVLSTYL